MRYIPLGSELTPGTVSKVNYFAGTAKVTYQLNYHLLFSYNLCYVLLSILRPCHYQ